MKKFTFNFNTIFIFTILLIPLFAHGMDSTPPLPYEASGAVWVELRRTGKEQHHSTCHYDRPHYIRTSHTAIMDQTTDVGIATNMLFNAAYNGNSDEVKRLVQEGIAHVSAWRCKCDEICDCNPKKNSAFIALKKGHPEITKYLISAGGGKNLVKYKNKELLRASTKGQLKLIEILIQEGIADINMQDYNGRTPLMQAKKENIIRCLINAGARLDMIDNDGCTALMLKIKWLFYKKKYPSIAKILIEVGADLNIVNQSGNTALVYAIEGKNIEIITALIKAGAHTNTRNKDDETPLELAINTTNKNIYMCLINPSITCIAKKKIETLLMIYRQTDSYLSELPKELLKIIITFAHPEYVIDLQTVAKLHPHVLVDTVPLETLALLIKNGTLNRNIIFESWKEKLNACLLYTSPSPRD